MYFIMVSSTIHFSFSESFIYYHISLGVCCFGLNFQFIFAPFAFCNIHCMRMRNAQLGRTLKTNKNKKWWRATTTKRNEVCVTQFLHHMLPYRSGNFLIKQKLYFGFKNKIFRFSFRFMIFSFFYILIWFVNTCDFIFYFDQKLKKKKYFINRKHSGPLKMPGQFRNKHKNKSKVKWFRPNYVIF